MEFSAPRTKEERKAKAEALEISNKKSEKLGWPAVLDTIIENRWFEDPEKTPILSAWLADFETSVEFINRLNIMQAS